MKKSIKSCLFLITFFGLMFFILPKYEKVYADESLYFDKEGNLVFATYDKLATSKIKYKTIGWVIKKYDEPKSAIGQNYCIIPKPEYYYEIKDDNNPGYVYIYFIVKKADIYKTIETKSSNWKNSLEKYGGKVYFDSIMTVVEYSVIKGGLYSGENDWGEVYYDYNGISTARWWAKPEMLKSYFDIEVNFPPNVTKLNMQYINSKQNVIVNSQIISSASIGSNSISNAKFDVLSGIPTGENLYAVSNSSAYYYQGNFIKNVGTVKIPVKVVTDYLLKWKDSNGKAKSESQKVERWYYVEKPYEYYNVLSFDVYQLEEVSFSNNAIGTVKIKCELSDYTIKKSIDNIVENHLKITEASYSAGQIVVNGINGKRPDIPEQNQQELANKALVRVEVRNDKLLFNDETILSDTWTTKPTIYNINNSSKKTFYKENLIIPNEIKNGNISNGKAVYIYRNGSKTKEISQKINDIVIHTPVVCYGKVSTPKQYNMSVVPKANQIVLDTEFGISINTYGKHRAILGYGNNDYSKYTGKYLVKFPFEVSINNFNYDKNEWIEINNLEKVYLPKTVSTGMYKIQFIALSKNSDNMYDSRGNNANLLIEQYGASDFLEIEVVGSMYGFCIEDEERETYYVGNKLGFWKKLDNNVKKLPIYSEEKNNYVISLNTNGFGSDISHSICGEITYYCIDDNQKIEVDVYNEDIGDYINKSKYIKLPDKIVWTQEDKSTVSDNVYKWTTKINLGNNIIVLPKGKNIDNKAELNIYAIRSKNILINLEIKGCCGEKGLLNYSNVENFKRGYCNMWKSEGYKYEFISKNDKNIVLNDGDVIILRISDKIYDDYEIIGTH